MISKERDLSWLRGTSFLILISNYSKAASRSFDTFLDSWKNHFDSLFTLMQRGRIRYSAINHNVAHRRLSFGGNYYRRCSDYTSYISTLKDGHDMSPPKFFKQSKLKMENWKLCVFYGCLRRPWHFPISGLLFFYSRASRTLSISCW